MGLLTEAQSWLHTGDIKSLRKNRQSWNGASVSIEPPMTLNGRTVVRVDDGLATGSTMKAAVEAVRAHDPARIIPAPVAIRAHETPAGTTRAVKIVDAEGSCTRIRFRAAPPSEVLDGIAPGTFPTG